MAVIGLIGFALPCRWLSGNWLLMAVVLLFWGGSVSGLYTVGLSAPRLPVDRIRSRRRQCRLCLLLRGRHRCRSAGESRAAMDI